MIRSVFGKVMWVGRATVFLVGLAVILALMFGVASVALAGMGVGAPFNLGKINKVDRVSTLVNEGIGPALSLQANSGAPLKVNSTTRVAKLNADMVDGMHASALLEPRGYAHISIQGEIDSNYPSEGIEDVVVPAGSPNLYCFKLAFTPKAAVGSPYFTNAAVVALVTPPNSNLTSACPTGFEDAAARTFGSNGADAAINFQVIFI
jgi:hypothetical protein